MRSLEFRINAVEQVLKDCKTGWALNYWNGVLRELNELRNVNYYDRYMQNNKQYSSIIIKDI